MSQYGIHVPEGMPAQTIDEVVDAAEKMKDDAGEVSGPISFLGEGSRIFVAPLAKHELCRLL